MIDYKTVSKIEQDGEISALRAMHFLKEFCIQQHDCRKCPFFCPGLVVYGYEDECFLTRTDRFTPADWNVNGLVKKEEGGRK